MVGISDVNTHCVCTCAYTLCVYVCVTHKKNVHVCAQIACVSASVHTKLHIIFFKTAFILYLFHSIIYTVFTKEKSKFFKLFFIKAKFLN